MGANCRGIVTADVLELGLSRGAIATRKLEGVNAGQGTRGFILVRPLMVKVKAYVQFDVVLIRVSVEDVDLRVTRQEGPGHPYGGSSHMKPKSILTNGGS